MDARKRRSWGIGPLVNRVAYSALIAVAINLLIDASLGSLYGWYVGGAPYDPLPELQYWDSYS